MPYKLSRCNPRSIFVSLSFMESGLSENTSINSNSTIPGHGTDTAGLAPLVLILVLESTCLVVVLGNLLVVLAFGTYKKRTSPDILIFSLSLADLLDSVAALQMLVIIKYVLSMPWTRAMCDVFIVQLYAYRTASASTVTFMAAERALLLKYPIKHRNMVTQLRTTRILLGVWAFSFLCAVLPLIGVGHSSYNNEEKTCPYQLYDLGVSYTIFFEVLGGLMLCVTFISFVAIKISSGKFIRRQSSLGLSLRNNIEQEDPGQTGFRRFSRVIAQLGTRRRSHSTAGMTSMRRLTAMMTIVVIVYFISWLPFLLNNLVSLVKSQPPYQSVSLFAGVISLLHAVANPILYGKMSQRYRRGYIYVVKRMLALCGGQKPTGQVTSASHHSNTAQAPSAPAYCAQSTSADNPGYNAEADHDFEESKNVQQLRDDSIQNDGCHQELSEACSAKSHVPVNPDSELDDKTNSLVDVEGVLEDILHGVIARVEKNEQKAKAFITHSMV